MVHNISNALYARRRKALISLVNELRTVGAQDELDLPTIAVIGNQSSGKSSIVESISGIKLPRDPGTCTRCPIECRLASASTPWTCRISLRREVVPDSNQTSPINGPETMFGNTITDPSEVEPALRRAQLAALVSNLSLSEIVTATDEKLEMWMQEAITSGSSFTRVTVCVDIRGPEVTDLVFIDLPGLIQNAPHHVVQSVEKITMSYIQGRYLILVALPMTDDIENQKALRLARQVDPEGLRTIGVLTKPDMLTAGCTPLLENWIRVLEGGQHSLVHGYYCTRQLNDSERLQAPSLEQSRAIEENYFNTTPPWTNFAVKERLGMTNLIDKLGHLLVATIQAALPSVYKTANKLLADCHSQLASLPQPLLRNDEEPATCILRLIIELTQDVQEYVWGGNTFHTHLDFGVATSPSARTKELGNTEALGRDGIAGLIQEHRRLYRKFAKHICATAPDFLPWEDTQTPQASGFYLFSPLVHDEEDDDTAVVPEGVNRFTLTKMRQHIQDWTMRELPKDVSFSAKVALIAAFQASWPGAIQSCLDNVKRTTLTILDESLDQRFKQCAFLKETMRSYIIELTEKCHHSCTSLLQIELEKERVPFTQHAQDLEAETDKWLAKYQEARSKLLRDASRSSLSRATNVVFTPQQTSSLSQDNPGAQLSTQSVPSHHSVEKTSVQGTSESHANAQLAPTPPFQLGSLQGSTKAQFNSASNPPVSLAQREEQAPTPPPFRLGSLQGSTKTQLNSASNPPFSPPFRPGSLQSSTKTQLNSASNPPFSPAQREEQAPTPPPFRLGSLQGSTKTQLNSASNPPFSPAQREEQAPTPPLFRPGSLQSSMKTQSNSASNSPFSLAQREEQPEVNGQYKSNLTPWKYTRGQPSVHSASFDSFKQPENNSNSRPTLFPTPFSQPQTPQAPFAGSPLTNLPSTASPALGKSQDSAATTPATAAPSEDFQCMPSALASGAACQSFEEVRVDYLAKNDKKLQEALTMLAELGYNGLTRETLCKLAAPPDAFEKEIKVMAEVRGYFQIAYRRIIDNVPNDIDVAFVRAIAQQLQGFLIAKFSLGTTNANETCAEYLLEDPIAAKKRSELVARQKKLSVVLRKLESFGLVV